MSGPGLYLYALVGAGPACALGTGLAGEPLRRVSATGANLVGAIAGPMSRRPELSAEALSAHHATVRRLAELVPAILPVRFGQWLPGQEGLASWLESRCGELAAALTLVEGCVQMTLRVFAGDAGTQHAAPAFPLEDREDDALGPGARYLEARRRAAEHVHSLPEIAPLREALRTLLRAERIERALSAGRLVGTAYDLVPREQACEYTCRVEEMAPRLPFRVRTSGPWPPYAFAPGLAG